MNYPTILEVFLSSAETHSSKRAVATPAPGGGGDVELSYRELAAQSERVAAGLEHHGLNPGDKVALLSKPRPEWVVAFLGVLKAGGVAVPIDPLLKKTEIHRLVSATDAVGVVVSGELYPEVSGLATQEFTVVLDLGRSELIHNSDALTWEEIHLDREPEFHAFDSTDLAVLLCTSGTMGDAKAVMLAHENITSNVSAVFERLAVSSDDVVVSIAPWNHSFGLIALIAALRKGATIVYTNDYANLAEVMSKYQATILVAVPKLYHAIWERVEDNIQESFVKRSLARVAPRLVGRRLKRKLAGGRLRFFVSGSAPLSPRIEQGFRRLGVGMLEGYGMTEASPVIAFSTPFNDKYGSVGPPLSNVEARLVNVNEEGIGELWVRGPNVMRGYYKNEKRTREVIDEGGWLHTGDLAYLDEDGWIYLKGRHKNVIVLETGKNVYPEEIEWELERIPYIQDVLVRQGERKGTEVIQALIYPNYAQLGNSKTPEEVKMLIWKEIQKRNRHLATYKRLKSAQDIVIMDRPFEKTTLNDVKRYLYQEEKPEA